MVSELSLSKFVITIGTINGSKPERIIILNTPALNLDGDLSVEEEIPSGFTIRFSPLARASLAFA